MVVLFQELEIGLQRREAVVPAGHGNRLAASEAARIVAPELGLGHSSVSWELQQVWKARC